MCSVRFGVLAVCEMGLAIHGPHVHPKQVITITITIIIIIIIIVSTIFIAVVIARSGESA